MKEIDEIIENLGKIVKKESKEIRERINQIGDKLLNEKSQEFEKLSNEVQDMVGDLFVMDEINENGRIRKEPKILHMVQEEIENLLEKLNS